MQAPHTLLEQFPVTPTVLRYDIRGYHSCGCPFYGYLRYLLDTELRAQEQGRWMYFVIKILYLHIALANISPLPQCNFYVRTAKFLSPIKY